MKQKEIKKNSHIILTSIGLEYIKMDKNQKTILHIAVLLLVVFVFYLRSITYSVKLFDEITILKENYLPVCYSISEIIDLVKRLGLNQYYEATNPLYSNIISLRCNPFGTLHTLIIQFLFQKNFVFYHAYSLILHLINTALVFLILKKICQTFGKGQ